MELYKYCDKNGVNILQFKALKLSRIDEFNDPFEFRIAKCVSPIISGPVNALYAYQKESYRVICFTNKYNNLIMWSHYSRNHTGLLIKFETDLIEVNGKNITGALKEVDYKEEMIQIPSDFFQRSINEREEIIKYNTYRKYIDWQYEGEYRAIIKFDESECKRYISIPARAILEVIIGMNCSLETELQVLRLAQQEEFKHLKLERATIHDFKYQMQYSEICT